MWMVSVTDAFAVGPRCNLRDPSGANRTRLLACCLSSQLRSRRKGWASSCTARRRICRNLGMRGGRKAARWFGKPPVSRFVVTRTLTDGAYRASFTGLNLLFIVIPFAWASHWLVDTWGHEVTFLRELAYLLLLRSSADASRVPHSMLHIHHSVAEHIRLVRRPGGKAQGDGGATRPRRLPRYHVQEVSLFPPHICRLFLLTELSPAWSRRPCPQSCSRTASRSLDHSRKGQSCTTPRFGQLAASPVHSRR